MGTLRWMVERAGHEWEDVCAAAEPFDAIDARGAE
jgi:hypothetical protein